MRRFKILGLLITVALVAAACSASAGGTGGGGTSPSSNGVGGAVTISNESGSLWTCSFNPFLGDDTGYREDSGGWTYSVLRPGALVRAGRLCGRLT